MLQQYGNSVIFEKYSACVMSRKLSEFSQLKSVLQFKEPESGKNKKEKNTASKDQPAKRSRVVVTKSKAEIQAASEGIVPGTKVRLMETNDRGVVRRIIDGSYEIESDGLLFRAVRSEFVVTDVMEDYMMMKSVTPKENAHENPRKENMSDELTVDLHLERIPGSDGVPEWAALEFQMNYFRQILRSSLKYKGKKLIFIHGVGDGVLASSIRKELDEAFAISCRYTYNTPGITTVFVR